MTTLDVDAEFSVHDYRHGLKLVQQDRDTSTVENRGGFECPACGDQIKRLLVAESATLSFGAAPNCPFCLARADDSLLVLTHSSVKARPEKRFRS